MNTTNSLSSLPLSIMAGAIPEECIRMKKITIFEVDNIEGLTRESASSTSCTDTHGIAPLLQRVPIVKQLTNISHPFHLISHVSCRTRKRRTTEQRIQKLDTLPEARTISGRFGNFPYRR